jgi:hypothetical protein
MHYIVLAVKFDGELFISVSRNKQLFKEKNGRQKFTFSKSSRIRRAFSRGPQAPVHIRVSNMTGAHAKE